MNGVGDDVNDVDDCDSGYGLALYFSITHAGVSVRNRR